MLKTNPVISKVFGIRHNACIPSKPFALRASWEFFNMITDSKILKRILSLDLLHVYRKAIVP